MKEKNTHTHTHTQLFRHSRSVLNT